MNTITKGVLLALAALVCGGGVWWWLSGGGSRPGSTTGGVHLPQESKAQSLESHLAQSVAVIAPYDEAEVSDLLAEFREACAKACSQLGGTDQLDPSSAQALVAEASERLELYLLPSYDRYRTQVTRLSRRDPDGSNMPNIFTSREQFEKQAIHLRLLPFAPSEVAVRPLYRQGRATAHAGQQRRTYQIDLGRVFTKIGHDPASSQSTIFEVLVPVDAPDALEPKTHVRLVLGMAFARGDTSDWLPWCMSFYESDDTPRVIVPPWL